MSSERNSATLDVILPIVVSCIFFFLFIGHLPLGDWDEAIYADIAREFLNGPSRLIPSWNFHPWLERTPLFEWTTAGFFAIFGISEFWARAASALSGVLTGLITYRIVKQSKGRRLAWLALSILITIHGFFYQARFGTTDVMLTLWMTVSFWGIWLINEKRLEGWYLFWIGLALGVMTKSAGPTPIVITIVVVALKERWSIQIFRRPFWIGFALFLAIVAPWHIYMLAHFGTTFLEDYLGRQVLARSAKPLEGHTGTAAFYLIAVAKSAFPWSIFVFLAVIRSVRQRRLQLAECYALVILCFYTVIKTKLPWYITAIYPPLAIIAAQEIKDLLPQLARLLSRPVVLAPTLALFLVGLLFVDLRRPVRPEVLLIKDHDLRSFAAPLILCSDSSIPDLPAPVFYAAKQTVQAYVLTKPTIIEGQGKIDLATNDPKFRNPLPLSDFVSSSPRALLIDCTLLPELNRRFRFREMARNGRYSLGSVSTF